MIGRWLLIVYILNRLPGQTTITPNPTISYYTQQNKYNKYNTYTAIDTGSRHCYDLPAPVLEDDKFAFDLLARVEANDVRGVD